MNKPATAAATNHPAAFLSIGAVAKRVGFAVSALRYYEEVGLIPPALRRDSGHRVYPESVLDVLTLVRHCRDLGFSIDAIRELLALSNNGERDCVEARAIAQANLAAVRVKMGELRRLEKSLSRFVMACTERCAGGPAPDCTILSDLRHGGTPAQRDGGCCS